MLGRMKHVSCHDVKWFCCLWSQPSACSFHHWSGNFGGTGFPELLGLKNIHVGDALVARD
jgi:hypothetical protein